MILGRARLIKLLRIRLKTSLPRIIKVVLRARWGYFLITKTTIRIIEMAMTMYSSPKKEIYKAILVRRGVLRGIIKRATAWSKAVIDIKNIVP